MTLLINFSDEQKSHVLQFFFAILHFSVKNEFIYMNIYIFKVNLSLNSQMLDIYVLQNSRKNNKYKNIDRLKKRSQ